MSKDPREEAKKYITTKKVDILFEILGSRLARDKPEKPNEYILQELMNIAQTKQNGQPVTLFTKEDIEIMFTTFDITGRGYCSSSQLKRALEAVGAKNIEDFPETEKIEKSQFVERVYGEVLKNAY